MSRKKFEKSILPEQPNVAILYNSQVGYRLVYYNHKVKVDPESLGNNADGIVLEGSVFFLTIMKKKL